MFGRGAPGFAARPVELAIPQSRSAGRAAIFGLALAVACGGISFDVSQDLPEQTVKGSPLGGILPSFFPSPIPLSIDLQAQTQKMGTGPAQHAYLKTLTLSATPHATPSGNFDFLAEVHIFISSPNNSSLPKVEIATLNPVPKGQTTISLTPQNVDLLPYINAGAQIDSQASGTQPKQDFTFDGVIVVTVKV